MDILAYWDIKSVTLEVLKSRKHMICTTVYLECFPQKICQLSSGRHATHRWKALPKAHRMSPHSGPEDALSLSYPGCNFGMFTCGIYVFAQYLK